MASCSPSILINSNIVLYCIALFNYYDFLNNFSLSNPDVKDFLKCVSELRCEAAVKFAELGRERARPPETCALAFSQFWSLFHKDEPVGLRDTGTEQVHDVLRAGITIGLFCQKIGRVHHVFCCRFVDRKLSFEYVNGAG